MTSPRENLASRRFDGESPEPAAALRRVPLAKVRTHESRRPQRILSAVCLARAFLVTCRNELSPSNRCN